MNIFIDENNPSAEIYDPSLKYKVCCVSPESELPAIKFLGVYFDPALNFKHHISQLNIKLSKSLFINIIRRCKNILSKKSLQSLYYSLFHSQLIYGILAYSSANKTTLDSIITKHKMVIRCISDARYNAHTGPIFKDLKILPFESLVEYFSLLFISDFRNNNLPRSFAHSWVTVGERSNFRYPVRNANDYDIPNFRIELVKRLPMCRLPLTWNSFNHNSIKIVRSRNSFKKQVKEKLLENIETVCNRLLCPSCHLNV